MAGSAPEALGRPNHPPNARAAHPHPSLSSRPLHTELAQRLLLLAVRALAVGCGGWADAQRSLHSPPTLTPPSPTHRHPTQNLQRQTDITTPDV